MGTFMQIKPILKAMLLCDKTIVEEGTRKRSLIGLFDRIRCQQFPLVHGPMSIYVQFREIEGEFDFNLELFDVTNNKPINKALIKSYKVNDRNQECELVFNFLSVKFDHPGEYEFRIFVNELLFGQKSFKVHN